jgi:hypothetical protein
VLTGWYCQRGRALEGLAAEDMARQQRRSGRAGAAAAGQKQQQRGSGGAGAAAAAAAAVKERERERDSQRGKEGEKLGGLRDIYILNKLTIVVVLGGLAANR